MGDIDYVGMWYVARARHGIEDNAWYGFAAGRDDTMTWHTVPHREADGIGAVMRLLAARGYAGGNWPISRETREPALRELVAARHRQPRSTAPPPRWQRLDPQRAADAHAAPPAYCFLTGDQQAALHAVAAHHAATVPNWLLWTADRAARELFAAPGDTLRWVYPVNLRGAARQTQPHMNHCGGLTLLLDADTSPSMLAGQLRTRFGAQEHWRQWRLLTLGRYVGQRGVNLLYDIARGRPGAYAGSWSNLGAWPPPGMATAAGDDMTGLVCAAPGSPAYPLSIGTVDWHGRRSLSCRVHPVANADPGSARRLLAHWRSRALGG